MELETESMRLKDEDQADDSSLMRLPRQQSPTLTPAVMPFECCTSFRRVGSCKKLTIKSELLLTMRARALDNYLGGMEKRMMVDGERRKSR